MDKVLYKHIQNQNYKVHDIDGIIKDLKAYRIELLGNIWEDYYKERCPEHYLSLTEFIKEIDRNNFFMSCESNYHWYLHFYEEEQEVTIPRLVQFCRDKKLSLTTKNKEMICEACACQGCPSIEEHLGYTCEECKIVNRYTGYQGYCDE